jgi:hypothetical protein
MRENVGVVRANIAMLLVMRNESDRARDNLLEAVEAVEESGSMLVGFYLLDASTGLCASLGDSTQAARFHGAALAVMEQRHFGREPADERFVLSFVRKAREDLGPEAFAAAEAAGRALSFEEARAEVREWLSRLRAPAG